MLHNETLKLLVKKLSFTLLALAFIACASYLLSYILEGEGHIGYSGLSLLLVCTAIGAIDVVRYVIRNKTQQQVIHFDATGRIEERLEAIIEVLGYRLTEEQKSVQVFRPTFVGGKLNQPVSISYERNQAVVTGPLFVVSHVADRLETFNYEGISLGELRENPTFQTAGNVFAGSPDLSPASTLGQPSGFDTASSQTLKPRTS